MDSRYFGLMEVSRKIDIPYYRIIYAEQAGHLPDPMRIACKRVYTQKDLARITDYFAAKEGR